MPALAIPAIFYPLSSLTTDFNHEGWQRAPRLALAHDWRGAPTPVELQTAARVLWNRQELVFGFECAYAELDVDQSYDVNEERHALWERDVCEAFVRSPLEPHAQHYREFEVAPTGQWCDLIVDRAQMWHDWQWQSGMRTVSEIDEAARVWRVVMAVPFMAFGCAPQAGDVWHANLFRVSRLNGARQYLALAPTYTDTPNFHVAESFVELQFAA